MADFKRMILALATAGLLGSGAGQAALHDRGGGLIYDDVLDITWLADAKYARTSGYDSDGRMDFYAASTWAAGLSYRGYDDWRLPTALNQDGSGPCDGYNCNSSEMGHMFYNNMGAIAGSSILSGTNTANLGLFTNLHHRDNRYWFDAVSTGSSFPWYLYFNNSSGYQTGGVTGGVTPSYELYAWAVRPGDVAAIPEPETYAMLLAGLGLLGGVAKWRRRSCGAS